MVSPTNTLKEEPPRKVEAKYCKNAIAGFRQLTGQERALNIMTQVIFNGKKAPDAAMLEMGRIMAESIMLMERVLCGFLNFMQL